MKRRVVFHRGWTKLCGGTGGGQLKVRDAFNHIASSDKFYPGVYFSDETIWYDNPGNHWLDLRNQALPSWQLRDDDILFFAGKDWEILEKNKEKWPQNPILNIVHPRHTFGNDHRRQFLKYPAIRIAKSNAGKEILLEHGVNGPLILIPDTIDPNELPSQNPNPKIDLLIVGLKNPTMAKNLEQTLSIHGLHLNLKVQLPPKLPTRNDFFQLLNDTSVVCFLPNTVDNGFEGFYLPALEAMALKKLVICPDVIGNRDFCLDGYNCYKPIYEENAILDRIKKAISMTNEEKTIMTERAFETSKQYHIDMERKAYLDLLENTDAIWNQKDLFHE
jgi:hypothetical protein